MINEIINAVGRKMPSYIEGYGELIPYSGELREIEITTAQETKVYKNYKTDNKIVDSIRDVLQKAKIKDGMTISFHHHLRDGDFVLNLVINECANLGIKDLTIFSSSITNAHEPLIEHIKNGVVTGIYTSGLRGKLAKELTQNKILKKPIVFRSHGGRARAIEQGEVKIDIAFVAASMCDKMGNMTGKIGKSAFGSMGYPMVDVKKANIVIAITDQLAEYPLDTFTIEQTVVDYVVVIDEIGDVQKIASGATRITKSPTELLIAKYAADILIKAGYIKEGFSFQAGSGGASLAVVKFLKEYMLLNNITGSFASGGVTSVLVELLEEGLFKNLIDTQTFGGEAAKSLIRNKNHIEMSASMYANSYIKGSVANLLDIMIVSATEIDLNFNVNVLTGSTGMIMGAVGGHPDTAEGAKLTLAVAPLVRKRIPIIVDNVVTVVTPGKNIDVVVTEYGIAINPLRTDLIEELKNSGLKLKTIEELKQIAENLTGKPEALNFEDDIVGIVEYVDGSVIDVIRKVRPKEM